MSDRLHPRWMPVAHIAVFFLRVEKHDLALQGTPQRKAQLVHTGESRHLGPRCRSIGWRATARQARARQTVYPSNNRHGIARLQRYSGQPLTQTREGYPPTVNEYDPPVWTLHWRQHFEARASLVTTIVQQKLMVRVQASHDADSLKTGHLVHAPRPERDHLFRAGRKPVPLGLPQLTAPPLPATEGKERNAQDDRQGCENPRRSEDAGADGDPNGHAASLKSIN